MHKKDLIVVIVISGTILFLIYFGLIKLLTHQKASDLEEQKALIGEVVGAKLEAFKTETGLCIDLPTE
jgi:hypothetical protein